MKNQTTMKTQNLNALTRLPIFIGIALLIGFGALNLALADAEPTKATEASAPAPSLASETDDSAALNRPQGPKKIRVMIDPGHGGDDDGAAYSGIKEKNITLKVALELNRLLKSDRHFDPVMTRDSDVYISLNGRSEKAVAQHADVFLSIHANSSPEPKAKGTEFYFENQAATDEESLLLANKENNVKGAKAEDATAANSDLNNILTDLAHNEHLVLSQQLSQNLLESFHKTLKIKTRAIRQAPFRVLSVTMPATLIELGFISNPAEGKWLSQTTTQKEMAGAIYNGLKTFKEKLDKARSTNLK